LLGPLAHIGGVPVEETIAALSPALGVGVGALVMTMRHRAKRLGRRLLPRPARRPADGRDRRSGPG
jgi:hypothetical protein